MKMKFQYTVLILAVIFFAACQKDNYTPPGSRLQGAILYQSDSINVSYNDVNFQLWQSGFGKLTPINVSVDQNGSYSALLFNGDYKLIIPQGAGPFMNQTDPKTNSDTILVHVQGNQSLNIQVLPYYMIRNPRFSAGSDSTITATCKLEKIITDANARDVDWVALYISKTTFVDTRTSISTRSINGSDITDMNNISLNAKVPVMIPTQHYVFARIGVKIANVQNMIFSPVEKLQLK
ncbi:MAG TPA: DUF3823 domain-containing protein [Chitinophagaceae bacterium]